ncbi:MAG: ABC transporter permease [Oscillospiraceae bacterium]|nr:ABC transporter permease [Oscillospiraceae bacterium]
MKIFRLSLFNLKKNKREAAAILFLTLISAFLLGTFLSSIKNIPKVFEKCFSETGSRDFMIMVEADKYRDIYSEILTDDYGITDVQRGRALWALTAQYEKDGEKRSVNMTFVTESTEYAFEDFVKDETLSDNEIAGLEHPIYLPEYFKISDGFRPGDTFIVTAGGMDYPFRIAGFYRCGLLAESGIGRKCVISDYDYMLLTSVYPEYELMIFDRSESFDLSGYSDKCSESSGENFSKAYLCRNVEDGKLNEISTLEMYLYISVFFSAVTFAAVFFLIAHKIKRDIEDQMQQIGVLEALGYTSAEISLSYVCEYVLSCGIGAVAGGIAAVIFNPVMNSICTSMICRYYDVAPNYLRICGAVILVAVLVTAFAAFKAGRIRKIPPVTAFRKGIKTHHFGRNVFPLEKLKKSVNLRLSMKGIFADLGGSIGAAVCIVLAGTAFMFSVFTYDFFSGNEAMMKVTGMEIPDEAVTLMNGVDVNEFREELLSLPEVRKVNLNFGYSSWMYVKGSDEPGTTFGYDDYSETENIFIKEGRFPEYENEIAISLARAEKEDRHVGDSLVMIGDGGEKSYIITGIVPAMSNSRMNLYFTTEGYIRMNPNARPDMAEIYLNDGTDREAFEKKLTALYGANAKDTAFGGSADGTLEERIKSAADEKMAALISRYGITDVDYAIKIGDTIIKGNSSKFIIKEMTSMKSSFRTEIDTVAAVTKAFCGAAMVFIGIVVAVMLGIISSGAVKRQRKELGIMKSMGYTSKDLMIQIAMRILPTAVTASVIAVFCAVSIQRAFWMALFGVQIAESLPLMIISALVLVLFCLAVSYISASRIKKISVTELVTE